ncbi:MAG: PaaI family thioesterase [Candidatus Aminicenantes bacterium]|nr:PaaI family thioesterase [Candidatus Aminicenantes bacterium]
MSTLNLDDDHFCFACGRSNPDGLRLRMEYPAPGRCRAEFVPKRKFQGWRGLVHGGVLSTLLDEGFAHATGGPERGREAAAVTAEMTVRFKRPARVGRKLILEGKVVGRDRKIVSCESILRDEEGVEIAAATGKLVLVRRTATPT